MIRQATQNDLTAIAQVHTKCFPDSFSTRIGCSGGGYLLTRFYGEYLSIVPELFLVAENASHEIVGFCMGYYCENNEYMKNYLKHNAIRIGIRLARLLITGDRIAWGKVIGAFSKTKSESGNSFKNQVPVSERGDLLSICVLPEYRGNGLAQELISSYQDILLQNNRKLCLLSVDIKNSRGIRFYEKNGFVPYKEVGQTRTYAKILK